jgi:hypothetical protein
MCVGVCVGGAVARAGVGAWGWRLAPWQGPAVKTRFQNGRDTPGPKLTGPYAARLCCRVPATPKRGRAAAPPVCVFVCVTRPPVPGAPWRRRLCHALQSRCPCARAPLGRRPAAQSCRLPPAAWWHWGIPACPGGMRQMGALPQITVAQRCRLPDECVQVHRRGRGHRAALAWFPPRPRKPSRRGLTHAQRWRPGVPARLGPVRTCCRRRFTRASLSLSRPFCSSWGPAI